MTFGGGHGGGIGLGTRPVSGVVSSALPVAAPALAVYATAAMVRDRAPITGAIDRLLQVRQKICYFKLR
jgi:hypothetical protein